MVHLATTCSAKACQRNLQGSVVFVQTSDSGQLPKKKYCHCGGPEEGAVIACENEDCIIEWFHTDCLRIGKFPQGGDIVPTVGS